MLFAADALIEFPDVERDGVPQVAIAFLTDDLGGDPARISSNFAAEIDRSSSFR